MASPSFPQPISITATECRPSPQYNTTVTSGLSPPKPMVAASALAQLDESDILDDALISQHLPTQRAPKRRRGQVSEKEVETYHAWRLDIATLSRHI